MAIFVPFDFLGPNLIILVYPPFLSLYLGPSSPINFLTTRVEKNLNKNLLMAKSDFFDLLIYFSTKDRNSFALISVVLIFSFKIKAVANDFNKALLCPLFRENFLPFLSFLTPLEVCHYIATS